MNENFLQHVAEQMAHLKFGEDATEFNEELEQYEFTPQVQAWINLEIRNLRDTFYSMNNQCYPFSEGDDYWIIEDDEVVWSCWDEQSEILFDPNKMYFTSKKKADEYLMEIVFGTLRNGHDPRIIAELNKTLKGYQEQDILQELFEMYFDNSDLEDVIEFFKSRQHEV